MTTLNIVRPRRCKRSMRVSPSQKSYCFDRRFALFVFVLSIVVPFVPGSRADAEDLFASYFVDQFKETGEGQITLAVEGQLPSYVRGNLIRLGPSINHTPAKNYTNFLDGFGRVTKWEIEGESNKVSYQSNLIRSDQYNASDDGQAIVRHITQQPTEPKTHMGNFKIENMDNTDVTLYSLGDDTTSSSFVTVTDVAKANLIDMKTLDTLGPLTYDDDCTECEDAIYSGSHNGEWIDAVTSDVHIVNWLGKKTKGGYTVMIYTMNPATRRRRIVGSVVLDFQPYSIHAVEVTGDYAVLVLGHVELKYMEAGMGLCISCAADDKLHEEPTLVHVFKLSGESLGMNTKPEISFEIPKEDGFFVFHYVNSFISGTDGAEIMTVDMCAYTSMDGILGDYVLGDMHNIMTPSIRDSMPYNCDALRRMEINLTEKRLSNIRDLNTADDSGFQYRLELVSINPRYHGRAACWGWGTAMHVNNSPRYSDMGIAKIDFCAAAGAPGIVSLFYRENVYVGEPLFVPDPSRPDVEDAGSLLVVSKDGTTGDTKLLVIDAQSMQLSASVTAPIPTMYEFHGKFIPFRPNKDDEVVHK